MKPYGVPRCSEIKWPDVADADKFGMPSRVQRLRSKRKRKTRRIWKKKERAKIRVGIRQEIKEDLS